MKYKYISGNGLCLHPRDRRATLTFTRTAAGAGAKTTANRRMKMAKVLIVDDDPDVVEAVTLILEKEGHTVQSASNRREGHPALTAFQPDLLLLDVMMDEPDEGLVMAQELRRDGFSAPILMMTSLGKVTGLEYGRDDAMIPVDAFLEKPVAPQILLQAVRRLLEKKED
jgi:DNA-binding response OmpR family regulator